LDDNSSKDNIEFLEEEKALANLEELKNFLSTELNELGEFSKKAFTPITDGLGLESPLREKTKKEPEIKEVIHEEKTRLGDFMFSQGPQVASENIFVSQPIEEAINKPEERIASVKPATVREPSSSIKPELKELIDLKKDEISLNERKEKPEKFHKIPPIPLPSKIKRFFAGLVDQIFIYFLFATLIFSGFLVFNKIEITNISIFIGLRILLGSFFALWFSYYIICIGILNMTFGMWVWDLKINYGSTLQKGIVIRKILRIFFSLIFVVPVITSVLLLFTIKGKNLIDFLSGSGLHRTSV